MKLISNCQFTAATNLLIIALLQANISDKFNYQPIFAIFKKMGQVIFLDQVKCSKILF